MPESLSLLVRGFIIGLSIAAPVGPIGVLCIRRTLAYGRLTGLLSGLGAATADMLYGAIAAFGVAFIIDALSSACGWLGLLGGAFLLYLGVNTMRARPTQVAAESESHNLASAYLSTFALTLTNPATILSFIGIFAGVMPAGATRSPLVLVLGVFAGSAAWWLLLSYVVGLLRTRLSDSGMLWINRISGLAILSIGVIAITDALQHWRSI